MRFALNPLRRNGFSANLIFNNSLIINLIWRILSA